jgi:hypothetical protein
MAFRSAGVSLLVGESARTLVMLIEVALSQGVMTVVVDVFSMIMQRMTGVKEEGMIYGGLDGHCEAHFYTPRTVDGFDHRPQCRSGVEGQ